MTGEPTSNAPIPSPQGERWLSRVFNQVERFAERHASHTVRFFEERAVDVILRRLEGEIAEYDLRVTNNMAHLMSIISLGDVVLVEGRRRISWVVQKITSSPWSHAMLYVGNGQVLEAEDHGVVVSPIMKYADHNIRLCSPRFLDEGGRHLVVELAMESLGRNYDRTNIRNLLLSYFARGRNARDFIGNMEECQEMCSGLLSRAFEAVGHPVRTDRHHSQIVPRDFDLSANFAVVKFNEVTSPFRREQISTSVEGAEAP